MILALLGESCNCFIRVSSWDVSHSSVQNIFESSFSLTLCRCLCVRQRSTCSSLHILSWYSRHPPAGSASILEVVSPLPPQGGGLHQLAQPSWGWHRAVVSASPGLFPTGQPGCGRPAPAPGLTRQEAFLWECLGRVGRWTHEPAPPSAGWRWEPHLAGAPGESAVTLSCGAGA